MTIDKLTDQAHLLTYGGSAGSIVIWGLHISEIAAIVSAFVAVCGLAIQVFIALAKLRYMKRNYEETHGTKSDEG